MARSNFGAPGNEFGVYPDKGSGWSNLNPETLLTAQEEADLLNSGISGGTTYTFTQDQEEDIQQALGRGEEAPSGYFEPQFPASTRVEAYRWVPDNMGEPHGPGSICVKFIKRGDRYVYPNVPYGTYKIFSTPGTSKGKFINDALNHSGYHRATDEEVGLFFNGF
jgi:hypothetical protein